MIKLSGMEQGSNFNKDSRKVLSYEEAKSLAVDLLKKYKREMVISSQDEKSNPNIYEENSSIKYFLEKNTERSIFKLFRSWHYP